MRINVLAPVGQVTLVRTTVLTALMLLLSDSIVVAQTIKEPRQRQATTPEAAVESQRQQEPIFSGPQPGEPLPTVPVFVHRRGQPSESLDLAELAGRQPLAIAFMHVKNRPAFALARLMNAFAKQKNESALGVFLIVLTDDRSGTEDWLVQIDRYFEQPTRLGVADGGIEGPGALGLNRLVTMTILVAAEGKVTANFALTDVSVASDGPPVLKAMNEVSGGGPLPKVEDLLSRPQMQRSDNRRRSQP